MSVLHRPLTPALIVAGLVVLLVAALSASTARGAPPTCMGVTATIVGTNGPDRINGTPGRDVIVAWAGADVINAAGGNDLICAGLGHDVVTGGPGNDVAYGGKGNDILKDADGNDRLFGGPGHDRLTDAIQTNLLDGGPGNNVIKGPEARNCAGKPATWVGTGKANRYKGTPGDDVIVAAGGDDIINGGGGHDLICGGDGNDKISGDAGIDTIYGETGNDHIRGGRSTDLLRGDAGNDVIDGEHGPDMLRGGSGNDVLRGGDENDDLYGGNGSDRLFGGRGTNFCTAGTSVRCDARPARDYPLGKSWTASDKTSYGQAAWLRYEMAKDTIGGPYTGGLSDSMFNRLSGITCGRCTSLTHDHKAAISTVGLRDGFKIVIDKHGEPRMVLPPLPPAPDWTSTNEVVARANTTLASLPSGNVGPAPTAQDLESQTDKVVGSMGDSDEAHQGVQEAADRLRGAGGGRPNADDDKLKSEIDDVSRAIEKSKSARDKVREEKSWLDYMEQRARQNTPPSSPPPGCVSNCPGGSNPEPEDTGPGGTRPGGQPGDGSKNPGDDSDYPDGVGP